MRFLRLDLTAFGPFTDASLDLAGGAEGLHLVYGPNEAGKSAALRAIADFLYGFGAVTPDNFVHDYGKLRIGASIRLADGTQTYLVRRKGRKDTLLDADGQPVAKDVLAEALRGVPRELFAQMFGLGHEALRAGGEELAAGGGEVGQSLFAAGLGTRSMKEVGDELAAEADALFRKNAPTTRVNQLAKTYADRMANVRELSMPGEAWAAHRKQWEQAEAQREQTEQQHRELTRELSRLQRLQRAKRKLPELAKAREDLTALGEVTILPEGVAEQRLAVQQKLTAARSQHERLEARCEELAEQLAEREVPTDLLAESEAVAELYRRSGSVLQAEQDLPGLRAQRDQAAAQAEAVLTELGRDVALSEAESLRLTAAQRAEVQRLRGRLQELQAQADTLTRQQAQQAKGRKKLAEQLADLPPAQEADGLRAALREARAGGDLEARLAKATDQARSLDEQLAVALKALGLWQGTAEELVSLPVPSRQTVARFEQELDELTARIGRLEEKLADHQAQTQAAEREIRALEMGGAVPTEEDLAKARARRDAIWAALRPAVDGGAIDEAALAECGVEPGEAVAAHEQAVREADDLADRLRRESDRIARKAELQSGADEHHSAAEQAEGQLAEARDERERHEADWRALWEPAGIEPLPPREMAEWLQRRDLVVEKVPGVRSARAQVKDLAEQIASQRDALGEALAGCGREACGEAESLAALTARAEETLAEIDAADRRRASLAEQQAAAEREAEQTAAESEAKAKALAGCRKDWARTVAPLGLDAEASVEQAELVLERTDGLLTRAEKLGELDGRISAIEAERGKFAEQVRALCARVAPDLAEADPADAAAHLHARCSQAARAEAGRNELQRELEQARHDDEQACGVVESCTAQLAELCRQAGCEEADDLPEAEQQSRQARRLQSEIERLEQELLAEVGDGTLADLQAEADAVDADDLPGLLTETQQALEALRERQSELDQEIGQARGELDRIDGRAEAAEMAQQAQDVLSELAEAVDRCAVLRLASCVLGRVIDRYRRAHQKPVLQRAQELFRTLTGGSFASLASAYDDKDQAVLVGVRPDGTQVSTAGMSDGTCDQLYLALRLASLAERAESWTEPVPLILDDVLVHFDDDRARAALAVLGELSARTQILFFTHHEHLLALARESVKEGVLREHTLTV